MSLVIKKYKGERALQRGIDEMAAKGFVVDQLNSRKALASATAGILTRKQIHTVAFRFDRPPPVIAKTSKAGAYTGKKVKAGRGEGRCVKNDHLVSRKRGVCPIDGSEIV
jgi:hypothetical protein